MATDKDAYIVAHMPPDCVECEDFELDVTILGHLAATFQNPKFPGLRLRCQFALLLPLSSLVFVLLPMLMLLLM